MIIIERVLPSSSQSNLVADKENQKYKWSVMIKKMTLNAIPRMIHLNSAYIIIAISSFVLCCIFSVSVSTTTTLSTMWYFSSHQNNNQCIHGSFTKKLFVSSFSHLPRNPSYYCRRGTQNDNKIDKSSLVNYDDCHRITRSKMTPQLMLAIKGGGRSSSDRRRKKNNNDKDDNVGDPLDDGSMKNPKGFQSIDENISAGSRKRRRAVAAVRRTSSNQNKGVMDMALCIVPPDKAWDNIQRARHFARDPTFYKWPPAIRLFHPFLQKRSELVPAASSIADIIEKYNMEPFTITLDQLLILPHWEVLEANEKAQKNLPQQMTKNNDKDGDFSSDTSSSSNIGSAFGSDFQSIQQLIESEEQKGLQKLRRRRMKEGKKKKMKDDDTTDTIETEEDYSDSTRKRRKEPSPQKLLEAQQQQKSQFDGPCVICLEPNQESVEHIEAVREILRKELYDDYDAFSVSSSLSSTSSLPNMVLGKQNRKRSTFRAVLPVGCFTSVQKAVEVARKLQTLWEPLSFNVTDLHLVSTYGSASSPALTGPNGSGENNNEQQSNEYFSDDLPNYNSNNGKISQSVEYDHEGLPILPENREYMIRKLHGTDDSESNGNEKLLTSKSDDYGCDAMIMLMGEEDSLITSRTLEDNEGGNMVNGDGSTKEEDEEMLMNLIMSDAGIPGGADGIDGGNYDQKTLMNGLNEERPFSSITEKIKQNKGQKNIKGGVTDWLDDDDEWEEGATIVVGRTQFFMGELRQYIGMPASSTMDAKHRILGDNVNAAARRRGAVHRQGDRWNAGDYGTKEKDIR